jgi:hypothetical protein
MTSSHAASLQQTTEYQQTINHAQQPTFPACLTTKLCATCPCMHSIRQSQTSASIARQQCSAAFPTSLGSRSKHQVISQQVRPRLHSQRMRLAATAQLPASWQAAQPPAVVQPKRKPAERTQGCRRLHSSAGALPGQTWRWVPPCLAGKRRQRAKGALSATVHYRLTNAKAMKHSIREPLQTAAAVTQTKFVVPGVRVCCCCPTRPAARLKHTAPDG